jgi:hypothetical protein
MSYLFVVLLHVGAFASKGEGSNRGLSLVYDIADKERVMEVLKVGDRREVYRR